MFLPCWYSVWVNVSTSVRGLCVQVEFALIPIAIGITPSSLYLIWYIIAFTVYSPRRYPNTRKVHVTDSLSLLTPISTSPKFCPLAFPVYVYLHFSQLQPSVNVSRLAAVDHHDKHCKKWFKSLLPFASTCFHLFRLVSTAFVYFFISSIESCWFYYNRLPWRTTERIAKKIRELSSWVL